MSLNLKIEKEDPYLLPNQKLGKNAHVTKSKNGKGTHMSLFPERTFPYFMAKILVSWQP